MLVTEQPCLAEWTGLIQPEVTWEHVDQVEAPSPLKDEIQKRISFPLSITLHLDGEILDCDKTKPILLWKKANSKKYSIGENVEVSYCWVGKQLHVFVHLEK